MVLAIAGLIFLVVFLALPALQRSQRDTARRQDVGRIISALQSYKADNGGQLPDANQPVGSWNWHPSDGSSSTGISGYIGKLNQISIIYIIPGNTAWNAGDTHSAVIFLGSSCPGKTGAAQFAVVVKREGGGTDCQGV